MKTMFFVHSLLLFFVHSMFILCCLFAIKMGHKTLKQTVPSMLYCISLQK